MKTIILILYLLAIELFATGVFELEKKFNKIPNNILKNFDKMGVDDSLKLNKYESEYLNENLKKSRMDFDFSNKQIAFILSTLKKSKVDYFKREKHRYKINHLTIGCRFYVFDSNQKIESGGCDGAIVYFSKYLFTDKEVIEIITKSKHK